MSTDDQNGDQMMVTIQKQLDELKQRLERLEEWKSQFEVVEIKLIGAVAGVDETEQRVELFRCLSRNQVLDFAAVNIGLFTAHTQYFGEKTHHKMTAHTDDVHHVLRL